MNLLEFVITFLNAITGVGTDLVIFEVYFVNVYVQKIRCDTCVANFEHQVDLDAHILTVPHPLTAALSSALVMSSTLDVVRSEIPLGEIEHVLSGPVLSALSPVSTPLLVLLEAINNNIVGGVNP